MAISIKPIPLNKYKPSNMNKFAKSFADQGLARFILLEGVVEAGRTSEAWKRGGKDEGRERLTEEMTGALFWLGGVKACYAISNKLGKYFLNMRTADFDLGHDAARNPLKNFLHNESNTKTGAKFTESQIAKFKTLKIVSSILVANAMIGFVVPRINQGITRFIHRNDKKQQNQNPQPTSLQPKITLDEFMDNAGKNKSKDVSFGASLITPYALKFAFNLENNTTWQLLSTDVGTAGGRAISARNKDERREILFRDLSSIYFYMYNIPNMNKWLNKLEQNGRGTRIDSLSADYMKANMVKFVKENGNSVNAKEFETEMFGREFKFPENISKEFKNGYMNVEEFKAKIPSLTSPDKVAHYTEIADKMSKLQPDVAGVRRITLKQAEDVFRGGFLNNPDFLKEFYELSLGNNSPSFRNFFRKLRGKEEIKGIPNYLNPYKFLSNKSIEAVEDDLKYFVKQIIENAKNSSKDITVETLEKAAKTNSRYNLLNYGTGFVTSALFLSTLIPKMQYWITKKITGKDGFPGTEEYRQSA